MTVEPGPSTPTLDRDPALAGPPTRGPVADDLPEKAPDIRALAATDPAPAPMRFADPWHLHTQACYWDFRSAGWVCP